MQNFSLKIPDKFKTGILWVIPHCFNGNKNCFKNCGCVPLEKSFLQQNFYLCRTFIAGRLSRVGEYWHTRYRNLKKTKIFHSCTVWRQWPSLLQIKIRV